VGGLLDEGGTNKCCPSPRGKERYRKEQEVSQTGEIAKEI
jgi:hypothetical protein